MVNHLDQTQSSSRLLLHIFLLSMSVSDLIKKKLPLLEPFPEHHADASNVCPFGSVLVYLQLSDAVSFKNEIFYNM